jgi:hypothetical protein
MASRLLQNSIADAATTCGGGLVDGLMMTHKGKVLVVLLGTLGFALALSLSTPSPADATRSSQNNGKNRDNQREHAGGGTLELDHGTMAGAVALLAGGAAIFIERRRNHRLTDEP